MYEATSRDTTLRIFETPTTLMRVIKRRGSKDMKTKYYLVINNIIKAESRLEVIIKAKFDNYKKIIHFPLPCTKVQGLYCKWGGWNGKISNRPNGQAGRCPCGNNPLL